MSGFQAAYCYEFELEPNLFPIITSPKGSLKSMRHQRLAGILPVNKAVRADAPKQKTIILQTFAQFAATFSAVAIDNNRSGAYSSRLSLLRQPPLSRGLIFCSLKKADYR